jgi:6-pyruvoyltetrahydropterin/6-carboxytetrahydropterin synthase
MIIVRQFTFDSAHKLDWHKGKCKNLHGHTYRLQIAIKGEMNKNGIVMDFKELDKIVKQSVIEKLDHIYLNKIMELVYCCG